MKIDLIADLHGHFPKLEGGDLLIIAGDLTNRDTLVEYLEFVKWCSSVKYSKVIFISGNHDNLGSKEPNTNGKVEYLCDSGTEFEGLKIWGSPWSLWFYGINPKCNAFTGSESLLEKKYEPIPNDIDILITHCPPYGIFDTVKDYNNGKVISTGSESLRNKVREIKPKIHVFGHIHEHGCNEIEMHGTRFINASYVNEYYHPVNKPIRVELSRWPLKSHLLDQLK